MRNTSLKILNKLEAKGEMTLEEISKLVPKKFNDHRDYYVLAGLFKNGFFGDEYLPKKQDSEKAVPTEMMEAKRLFICSTADESAEIDGMTYKVFGEGKTLKGQKYHLTSKGSLYLSEHRTKRNDRVFTIFSGIIVGVVVAVLLSFIVKK